MKRPPLRRLPVLPGWARRIRVPSLAPLVAAVVLLVTSAALYSPAAAQESATPQPISIDDQFALASVGAPVMSPEGTWVAFTVTTTEVETDESHTRLWMAPVDPAGRGGGDELAAQALPMTRAGASISSPAWSPDGRYLSFLAAWGEDAETQVWVLDRRGGEARALTRVAQGVSEYAWSPEGSRLALVLRDPEPEDSTWTSERPKPWVVDRLQFKRDGVGYLTDPRRRHLYVLELDSDSLRQLTSGDRDEANPVWSPDGSRLAFVSNRTAEPDANSNTDIWTVRADRASPTPDPTRVTTNAGADGSPAWSPDGRRIAYVTTTRPDLIWYATRHLAVVNADGSDPQVLTLALDRNVSSPRFGPQGGHIYFGLENSAENHLAAWDLEAGAVRRITAGPLSLRGFDVSPGGRIAARVSRTDLPGDIFLVDPADPTDPGARAGGGGGRARAGRGAGPATLEGPPAHLRRLTAVNDSVLARLALGEVREERWRSAPGVEVEGFVHLPPDFKPGVGYPLLLRLHGGPVSQYSHSFNFEAHLFAANGYVVLSPNPRGSSGYGQDFSAVLWADWGNPDVQDVMAGVDHLIAQGLADGDRMGVGGWSYGGILTNYVITQTDRFKGAITGASEVLYIANYGHDHYQRQWEAELGLPWEGDNRAAWERISPFNKVDRITTPTLIMGGERDWNVPIQNSEQLYQALRRRGVPTELVVYPGQSHGIRPVPYRRDRHRRYLEWYDRWVKASGARGKVLDLDSDERGGGEP